MKKSRLAAPGGTYEHHKLLAFHLERDRADRVDDGGTSRIRDRHRVDIEITLHPFLTS
jgi:hypothetical protein